jgi:hypothetical protein
MRPAEPQGRGVEFQSCLSSFLLQVRQNFLRFDSDIKKNDAVLGFGQANRATDGFSL